MQNVWVYDFSSGKIEETTAYYKSDMSSCWWVQDPFHPDNAQRLMMPNHEFFFSEKEANIALLNALREDKEETERMIAQVESRIRGFR